MSSVPGLGLYLLPLQCTIYCFAGFAGFAGKCSSTAPQIFSAYQYHMLCKHIPVLYSSTAALQQLYSSSTAALQQLNPTLQQLYSNSTTILQQFYRNSTATLQQLYSNSTASLQQLYSNSTEILQKFYSNRIPQMGFKPAKFCFVGKHSTTNL